MGVSQTDGRTEGWLYLVRLNRFGSQYTRKMFFVLRDNCLRSFKSIPSPTTNNARTAVLDSSVRVVDIGRESIQKKVFFTFSLYNTSKKNDQLKLGASSPEEAARWIQSFKNAASKGWPASPHNEISLPRRNWQSFRICGSKGMDLAIEQTCVSFVRNYPMTSDVIAPSPWKIFGCRNGLRLFKEAKDRDSSGRHWDNHPAIMSVCLIDGTSEAIFQTLMTLGPSRSEWDYCFYHGSVVEHFDGHTDVIHQQLYSNWMPWGMKRRDLLLQRYWRREDDGTYVILYHSVFHKKCPPKKGYVRACLKSGGYVVTPVNQGKQSFVKHMLAVDWKYWKFSLSKSGARSITISMLERVAALREMFRAKAGNLPSFGFFSRKFIREVRTPQSETEDVKTEIQSENEDGDTVVERKDTSLSMQANLMGLNDASDEFFDVPEPTDYELEHDWSPRPSPDFQSLDICAPKLSTSLVKKWHDRQVQKKGYVELPDMPTAASEDVKWHYGSTLPKDPSCTMPSSWNAADPSSFLVRGENYLQDQRKIKADHTLMQLVGADWLRSKQREDHLACRPGGIVQKYASKGGAEFFFVVNIQVPGATPYNLALYYMTETPLKANPLLEGFVNGDSAYRNSRFKLIPYISQGSWIVKQSVGKKACLVGQALEVNYFQGDNYIELDIDVGSSTVARGVVALVLGYLNNLVIELAFLIQANTEEELPEKLLGTCRINYLDASRSVLVQE